MPYSFTYSSVLVIAGVFVTIVGFKSWRLRRAMDDVETTTIGSVSGDGAVAVEGTVEPAHGADGGMQAPLSGRDCIAAAWNVDMRYDHDVNTNGPRPERVNEEAGEDAVPFVVNDGTGDVLVDPTPRESEEGEATPRVGDTDVHLQFPSKEPVRDRTNVRARADLGSDRRNYELEEALIEVGDEVYVQGAVRSSSERHSQRDLTDPPSDLVIGTGDAVDMVVSASTEDELRSNPFTHPLAMVVGVGLIAAGAYLAL